MKFLHFQIIYRSLVLVALASLLGGYPVAVQANPAGEIVINGSFKMEDLGSTLKIIQESKNGIIHWDDFSIKSGEITQFIQPSSSASVLNRVTGSARSEIMGQLLANGNVWVINPNGILVGGGARIDVGGLILSTLDVSNDDFLRGGDMRFAGASQEPITNFGTINAASGDVYLMAHRVENHGFIGALDGRVVLAADNEILIKQGTEGNVFLSGQVGHGHVLNNGEVVAADVAMMARNNNAFAMAVQNNGIVRAQTAEKSGGRVRLVAQGGAGVEQAGSVNVDGTRGGRVEIMTEGSASLTGTTTARGTGGGGGEIIVGSLQTGTKGVNVGLGAVVDASTVSGNGGSVEMAAAGDVRNAGLISAASAQGAGGSVKIVGGDAVAGGSGEINVSGGTAGGLASIDATGKLLIEGKIVADASAGSGGTVRLTGSEVELASTSMIDASGSLNGGTIFTGGGFGGRDSSMRNALTTMVASGATLNARGGTGVGGAVSLWSDGDMSYLGSLSVAGGQRGGFVEVSGKEQLAFAGEVDLAGGTLLLDPVNVRIAQAASGNEISAASLQAAWNSGNVVIHTGGGGSEEGNIVIESGVTVEANSGYSLSLFAHNNITIAPNVVADPAGATRVVNRGSGNINLVSGWDGTGEVLFTTGGYPTIDVGNQAIGGGGSPSLTAISAADILAGNYGAFGTKGAIEINPNAAHSVNIASGRGQTNLFGLNITMAPGDVSGEFAQIGWFHNGTDTGGTFAATGDINVYAKGNMVANSAVIPGTDWRYIQIGHGGRMTTAAANVQDRVLAGDITVNVAGGLLAQSGGTNNGWFKIGHGGKADGADVRVNNYGNVNVTSSSMTYQVNASLTAVNALVDNYIQLGHGGVNVRGEHAGNINVTTTLGELTVLGTRVSQTVPAGTATDTVARNFFQIGHGGFNSDHTFALPTDFNSRSIVGDEVTTIEEIRQAVLDGEDRGGAYATALALLQRRESSGAYVSRTSGKLGHAGNISVLANRNITLEAGGRHQAFAQIGHGGAFTAGQHGGWNYDGIDGADGNVSVVSTNGAIALTRNMVEISAAGSQIATLGTQAYVQVGHGGLFSTGGANGNINVNAGGGNISMYGGQSNAFAKIGHGGFANYDIGAAFLRGVREWNRDFVAGDILGNITVNASGNLIQRSGFRGSENFAQIGHGGYRIYATDDFRSPNAPAVISGVSTTVNSAVVTVDSTAGLRPGMGITGHSSIPTGALILSIDEATSQVTISAPATANASGVSLSVVEGNDMNGDGISDTYGAFVGDIRINVGGMVDSYAGQKNANHIHGADPLLSGQIEPGMAGNRNFVMIGHGGLEARSDTSGAISVVSVGDVRMESTGGWDAFDASSNLSTDGDTGADNFVLIGHGGRNSEHTLRNDNPFDGDQRSAGMTSNSVENLVMFEVGGVRRQVKLSSLTNTQIGAGRLVHFDSPIGWQVDTVSPAAFTRSGTRQITIPGLTAASALNIGLGTIVGGTAGVTANTVVTSISTNATDTIIGVSLDLAATVTGLTFLNIDAGGNRLNFDNPADRTVTAVGPTGATGQNTLTLQGSETLRNLFLEIGTEVGGTGIPAGTIITGFSGPQTLILSNNLTATATGNYTFAGTSAATRTTPLGVASGTSLTLQGADTAADMFLSVGSPVRGTGIPDGTVITGIAGSVISLSNPLTSNAAGNYSFGSSKLANQPQLGDYFGFENQTGIYQITGIERGTGANVGERFVTFTRTKDNAAAAGATGSALQARVANDTNVFFLTSDGAARDPIQEQAGVGRNEVQTFVLPNSGTFTLQYTIGGTTALPTDPIAVTTATSLDLAIAAIDAALEARTGVAGSDFFRVTPGPVGGGQIQVQFQGTGTGNASNQDISTMTGVGVTVGTLYDGVAAAGTSYLFATLSAAASAPSDTSSYITGTVSNINAPVFSASVNPEFAEFINTLNTPVNFTRGLRGSIQVDAGGSLLLTSAQRRNLETDPYAQANTPLPTSTTGTSIKQVPQAAVRSFVQIGHGGTDNQMEGFLPDSGQVGDISVKAKGEVKMVASDFARQLESGQTVTIETQGTITTTTTAANPPSFNTGVNVISLHSSDTISARNVGVGSSVSGPGIPAGTFVTELIDERSFRISSTTTAAASGTYSFGRNALTFNNKSSPDSRENYVMIGHGGVLTATGALVEGNVVVDAGQDITLQAGRGTTAFAMIGHGGRDGSTNALNRNTTFRGSIDVASQTGGVSIAAGARAAAFAMIGHGGHDFDDPGTGVATVGPTLLFDDADNEAGRPTIYTLRDPLTGSFLNNGVFSRNPSGTGVTTMRSDLSFEVATVLGDINVRSGGVHASTGNGLTISGGMKTSAVWLVDATGVPIGEGTLGRFAQIGHGGANLDARIGDPAQADGLKGNINVTVSSGNALLQGGIFTNDSARIGHGGRDFSGPTAVTEGLDAGSSFYGDVTLNLGSGYDLLLKGGDAPLYDTDDTGVGVNALVRHSLAYFYNPVVDDFVIDPVADLARVTALENALRAEELSVGLTTPAGSVLTGLTTAQAVSQAALRRMGLIADRRAGRDSQLDGDAAFAQAPFQASSLTFYPLEQLNGNGASIAQIGHGGSLIGGTGPTAGIERWSGNIMVNSGRTIGGIAMTGRDVQLLGGDGRDNFAMIGHGGYDVRTGAITITGDVTVNAGNDLILKGGDYFANAGINSGGAPAANRGSFAQVGHMVSSRTPGTADSSRSESTNGAIRATSVRDIILSGGGGNYSHARIGNGAAFLGPTNVPRGGHTGPITVHSGRDIVLNPAEIREDDKISDEAYGPLGIAIARQRNDNQGTYSSTQIGHGGVTVSPVSGLEGNIEVMAWGNLVAGGLSKTPNLPSRSSYEPGSVRVSANLQADPSRGPGAYAKIGHGDYYLLSTFQATPSPPGTPIPAAGRGNRSGNISVATGMDLWAAGLQIGHVDPVLAPNASTISSNVYVAVSRRNPTSTGPGRLFTNWSVSNFDLTINDGTNVPGGQHQTVLPTTINSGSDGQVRIYMPDRAYGRANGSSRGATPGLVDSNFMQGRQLALAGVDPSRNFGTLINGTGYNDPENDSPSRTGVVYPTLRGSTLANSGSRGDGKGDEGIATEFTMTKGIDGLPDGAFTPEGVFPSESHAYGSRYRIYYSTAAAPAPIPPGGGGGGGGGGGVIPPIIIPPIVPSYVSDLADQGVVNDNPLQIDRFSRQDELVDRTVFTFDSWRQGYGSGNGYWVFQQQGASSVILPEDRPVAGSDQEGLPFQVFELKRLTDWESGVLVYDPVTGFVMNPRPRRSSSSGSATEGTSDPFGFGAPTNPNDEEEERRRSQPGSPSEPSSAPAPGASMEDPFGPPPGGTAPAMGAPSDDPFGSPAPGGSAPAMSGADDPFMTPTPGSPATPSN